MLLMSMVCANHSIAQNLLDLSGWTIGQQSTGVFGTIGESNENVREWGEGPLGNRVVLWKAQPNGGGNDDGGWNSQAFPVNSASLHRFAVWIKKTNSNDGTTLFGCSYFGHTNTLNLDGAGNGNPYFFAGDLPELNKWFLLIGYVHGSGDISAENYGGVYDSVSGLKVADCVDFKFAVGATEYNHRAYLYYDSTIADRQYFYGPRVDVINGNEPPIESLLGLSSKASSLAYFPDKVGIKTRNVGDYELAVNGKVRAQEIKVENANWPDYVFAKDYEFPSLKETEQHIKKRGHLPGIPSALDIKEKGIDLGDMNAKLLKKIEELTLFLIQQDNQIKVLEDNQKLLMKKHIRAKNKQN